MTVQVYVNQEKDDTDADTPVIFCVFSHARIINTRKFKIAKNIYANQNDSVSGYIDIDKYLCLTLYKTITWL